MTLSEMLQRSELERLAAGKREVSGLITKASRRLEEAGNEDNYGDSRLEFAYLTVLFCATAALRASGYRATRGEGHHVRTLDTLLYTLHVSPEKVEYYHMLRRARNTALYDELLEVSEVVLVEALNAARELLGLTEAWLRKHHPQLLP